MKDHILLCMRRFHRLYLTTLVPEVFLDFSLLLIFLGIRELRESREAVETRVRVYYSLAVWRFKPILSAGLRFHSHLSGGLRLRNNIAVAGNLKFSSRFSVFACFCGGYSNRVKRLRRLSANFILLKVSLFKKGLKTCTFTIRYKHLEQSLCL